MTDIHVCPDGETVVNLDPEQRLLQGINSVNASHSDASLCVITGDLVDRGEIEAYRVLRRCLAELRVPWRLLLGNHDNRDNFRDVFPEAPIDPSGYIQSVEDIGDLRVIFLDTLDSGGRGSGILCQDRMRWLTRSLEEAGDRRVLLFMHHPPKSVRVKWFENILLSTSDAFMSLIAEYPSIMHVAFGHLHLTTTGSWGATSFSCNRGTCHKIALNLTEQRIDFVRTGPAYDVILVDGDEIIVHHVDPVGAMELLAFETFNSNGFGSTIHNPADGGDTAIEC